MKFLVLYEELASYFLECLNYFAENNNCRILVFTKKINPIAPFHFKNVHPNIQIIERETVTFQETNALIASFKPDFTYLSGWIYKPYFRFIKTNQLPNVILGLDNQYTGTLKQKLGAIYFKTKLKRYIKAAFVPGEKQAAFAKKLGFKDSHIEKNLYCCDYKLFDTYFQQINKSKSSNPPKRFLFVGRYVEEKGINLLWESFIELQTECPNEWELWCVGTGPILPVQHPKIKHLGFIQPENFIDILKQTSVFVLPSFFEPWGVVIHEYSCAGFPIISTSNVGAAELFIEDAKSGYIIESHQKEQLKKALKNSVSLSNSELVEMCIKSKTLSHQITPQIWEKSLLKLVHE